MKNKIVYIDMDDVVADFAGSAYNLDTRKVDEYKMFDPNFFLNLKPIAGSSGAIYEIINMGFDVRILTQPLAQLASSYSQKVNWIQLHFPNLYNKVVMTQDKGLCIGDYLIDDNAKKWKSAFESNGGYFVHFKYGGYNGTPEQWVNPSEEWMQIVNFFRTQTVTK